MNATIQDVRALLSGPIALEPTRLQRLLDAVAAEARGEGVDIRAALGPMAQMRGETAAAGRGVGVLQIAGVILHRARWWPASTENIALEFDRMVEDEAIETIILDINSPGGTVYGVPELARKIFEARKTKRIIAVANALSASAAYWIGTAAGEFVVTPSGEVGSIGVYGVHLEFSRLFEKEGITATVIRAGARKAEGNPFEPLSDEAREHLQAQMDVYYEAFVRDVARHRGVSEDVVMSEAWGQGRTVLAEEAVELGMADRIATLEEVLADVGVDRRRQIGLYTGATVRATATAAAGELLVQVAPGAAWPIAHVFEAAEAPEDERDDDDGDPLEDPDDDVDLDGDGSTDEDESPAPEAASEAREEIVDPQKDSAAQTGAATATATPAVQVGADREAEQQRAAQIVELCQAHGVLDRAAEYIRSGKSVGEIGLELAREARENLQAMTAPAVELSEKEARRYSISRAILSQLPKSEGGIEAGFEREVSEEIEKNLPKGYKPRGGIFVPHRIKTRDAASFGLRVDPALLARVSAVDPALGQRLAALNTLSPTAGGNAVFTEPGDLIDMLRPRMRVVALGAQTISGLNAEIAFPRQTGSAQWTWRPENPGSDLADTDATIGQVLLSPKSGSATTGYTRQFLTLGSIDVDAFVQNDLALVAALGIDAAAINGPGSDAPTGILNTSGVNVVPIGTDGGRPTFEHIVQLETEVASDDADIGAMAYLTTPGIRGLLKVTQMFEGTNGMPVWQGNEMNGYRAEVSTQVPSDLTKGGGTNLHAILFGVWSQLIIGYFGAYELVVDPYSQKKKGIIEVTAFQMAGVALRNPEAFAVIKDASLI